jgi:hypothetical protein
MKLILLHDERDKAVADQLLRHIKSRKYKLKISCRTADFDRAGALGNALSGASHLMAVLPPQAAVSPWFAFTAGFALGSGRSLLCFPPDAGRPLPSAVTGFILIKDPAGLDAYLDRETSEWSQKEAVRQAQNALLERGIPFSGEALEDCIKRRNSWAVVQFLQGGFSPDSRNQSGVPLICLAARAGDRDIVEILLKAGAGVNLRAEDRGTTALIDSALGKHLEIMKLLLDAGVDIDLKSKDGQSALIISVGLNDEAAVELLLKAGAKADDPDLLGVSARKYAAIFNKPAMVELFTIYAGPPQPVAVEAQQTARGRGV